MNWKKLVKRILLSLLVLVIIGVVWQFELVKYGWMQLRGQLEVVNESIPLEAFLELPETTDQQKHKIQIIQEAKQYAFDSLGINFSENYSTIFDQKGQPSMYVITACEPFAFKPMIWRFPVVGGFPYKGFFDREKAVEEARAIRQLPDSLDVGLRTAGGWSTLGWFKDPVLSNMLNRSDGQLASLIIHELTHGTLFVKDSVTFNENLATFIGDAGAIRFMSQKFGPESEELKAFVNDLEDEVIFKEYMLEASNGLKELYDSFSDEPYEEKKRLKSEMIDQIIVGLDTVAFKTDRFRGLFQKTKPNNTYFMSLLRYNSQQDILQNELDSKYNGDLKAYMSYLKTKYPTL